MRRKDGRNREVDRSDDDPCLKLSGQDNGGGGGVYDVQLPISLMMNPSTQVCLGRKETPRWKNSIQLVKGSR
jgi:hypothetical protein